MADVKILEINGTEFNIKDEKARQDIEKANTQLSTIANEDLTIGEDGKLYIKQADGTKKGTGITLPTQDIDLTNYVTKEELTQGGTVTFRDVTDGEIFTLGSSSSGGESGGDTSVTYNITNNLTNVINSNSATSIEENESYSANITANDGYSLDDVIVVMGGNDITSSVYSDGAINISVVTGNLIITATATKVSTIDIPETDLLAYYDMSKDLVDGKIQDLSGNDKSLKLNMDNVTYANGYLQRTSTKPNSSPAIDTSNSADFSYGNSITAIFTVSQIPSSGTLPFVLFGITPSKNTSIIAFSKGIIVYQSSFNNVASNTAYTVNDLQTIAVSINSTGNETIYINGVKKSQIESKTPSFGTKLSLLNGYVSGTLASPYMYNFALYNSELDENTIATISNTLLSKAGGVA